MKRSVKNLFLIVKFMNILINANLLLKIVGIKGAKKNYPNING